MIEAKEAMENWNSGISELFSIMESTELANMNLIDGESGTM